MTGLFLVLAIVAVTSTSGQFINGKQTMECRTKAGSSRYRFCLIPYTREEDGKDMTIKKGPGNTCAPGTYELDADYGFVFIKITGYCGGTFIITKTGKSAPPTKAPPKYTLPPVTSKPDTSYCGIKTAGTGFRIVGGQQSRECQYPWMIRILASSAEGTSLCGGSIIDKYHILTAAHCVSDIRDRTIWVNHPGNLKILTGSRDKYKQESRDVAKVFVHKSYTKISNDIAVVRLTKGIKYDKCHSPVCLTKDQKVTEGRSCRVMGWGRTRVTSSKLPVIMKWIEDPMASPAACQKKYNSIYKDSVVCGKAISFCRGDSGGPYVCLGAGNKYYQYGVVSAHLTSSECNGSGLYSFVPYHYNWIQEQIKTL